VARQAPGLERKDQITELRMIHLIRQPGTTPTDLDSRAKSDLLSAPIGSPGGRAPARPSITDHELVVLVDEQNRILGTMPKAEAHQAITPLHRAFSTFVFRASDKRLLLQQRSAQKRTWPLMWANSCCGHPGLGESNVDAARRRLKFELGLEPTLLEEVAPYRYCFTRNGIMENETCPILVGIVEHEPVINPDEVQAVRWREWNAFLEEIERDPTAYSEWCVEEARILQNTPRCQELIGL
jgi:isopentenyl-diphosphate delta-isomerase